MISGLADTITPPSTTSAAVVGETTLSVNLNPTTLRFGDQPTVSGPDDGANTPEAIEKAAVKFDGNKVRWDLIPWDSIEQLAILYTIGAVKYADNNWLRGFRYGRTVAAAMRHLMSWWLAKLTFQDGLDHDNDEICQKLGVPTPSHLTASLWNIVALLTFELRGIGVDDRPTSMNQS